MPTDFLNTRQTGQYASAGSSAWIVM